MYVLIKSLFPREKGRGRGAWGVGMSGGRKRVALLRAVIKWLLGGLIERFDLNRDMLVGDFR